MHTRVPVVGHQLNAFIWWNQLWEQEKKIMSGSQLALVEIPSCTDMKGKKKVWIFIQYNQEKGLGLFGQWPCSKGIIEWLNYHQSPSILTIHN